jgi:hypothetical protein
MAKLCNQPLKTNPFTTNRDPHTGKWVTTVDKNLPKSAQIYLKTAL